MNHTRNIERIIARLSEAVNAPPVDQYQSTHINALTQERVAQDVKEKTR